MDIHEKFHIYEAAKFECTMKKQHTTAHVLLDLATEKKKHGERHSGNVGSTGN
jgi:hypothetical protein